MAFSAVERVTGPAVQPAQATLSSNRLPLRELFHDGTRKSFVLQQLGQSGSNEPSRGWYR